MDPHSLLCLDFARVCEILAGYALTGLGKSLATSIRPIARVALVRRWLAQVEELQRLIEERGRPPFGGITDVRDILQRCAPPLQVTVEEVAQVAATLAGTHAVAQYLRDLPDSYPELLHLAGRVGDFQAIADRIRAVIDERAKVRDSASPKLQGIREEIEAANREIHQTVERLLRDSALRRLLQYPNHTWHGDRVVFPLRIEYRGRLPGIVHRTSDSGATLYVEPAEVVELNNRISNLRSEEQEEIGRLLWELAHEIHLNGREIRKTLDTLAVIDLMMAKLRFAEDYELRCPRIGGDGTLSVRAARHPLLVDLARRKQDAGDTPFDVVPIDYRIGHDFNLLIITGPNTGGKTVALKTIGLLSLMVQAGLPVPVAEESEFGVFSNVLIDVGDEQSMQQSLSTFSGHLTRILDMLRHAGPRALLLIDELGAGTDPDEGAALGRAILDEILRLDCRGIVTTHLGALKGFALTRPRAENACVEFDSKTLEPTYHVSLGEAGQSNAIEIAQRMGMSRRMISAARRNLSRKVRVLHAALEGTRTVKRQAESARREAETAQVEAGRAQSAATVERSKLERQQADFRQWVQRVVHLQQGDAVRVRDFDRDGKIVRIRLEQQRAEVDVGAFSVEVPLGDVLPPKTPPPPPRPPRETAATGAGAGQPGRPGGKRPASARGPGARPAPRTSAAPQRPKERRRPEPPALTENEVAALEPFDAVWVKRFEREGQLVRLKPAKKLAVVSVGLLEVEVPYDGLALPPRRQPPPPRRARPAPPRKPPKEAPAAAPENKPPTQPDAVDARPTPPSVEQTTAGEPGTPTPPEAPPASQPPATDSGSAEPS